MKGIGSGPAHLSPVSAGAGPCGGWSIDRSIISLSHISEKNLSEVVEIDHIPRKVEHSQTDCDKQYSSDFSAQEKNRGRAAGKNRGRAAAFYS
jgi:hypothetical protein